MIIFSVIVPVAIVTMTIVVIAMIFLLRPTVTLTIVAFIFGDIMSFLAFSLRVITASSQMGHLLSDLMSSQPFIFPKLVILQQSNDRFSTLSDYIES